MYQDDFYNLEFGLYRNGDCVGGGYYQSVYVNKNSEFNINIPSRENGAQQFGFRARITSELVDDWFAIEAGLYDYTNVPIGTIRPALIYAKPCDIPSTIVFPSLMARPLKMAGIWVVTVRGVGSIEHERSRYETITNGDRADG